MTAPEHARAIMARIAADITVAQGIGVIAALDDLDVDAATVVLVGLSADTGHDAETVAGRVVAMIDPARRELDRCADSELVDALQCRWPTYRAG